VSGEEDRFEKFSDVEEAEDYVLNKFIENSYFESDIIDFFDNSSNPAENFKKYYDFIIQSDFDAEDITVLFKKIILTASIKNRIKKSRKYKFHVDDLVKKLINETTFIEYVVKNKLFTQLDLQSVSDDFFLMIIEESMKKIISEVNTSEERIVSIDVFISNFIQFLIDNDYVFKKEKIVNLLSKFFESYGEDFLTEIFPLGVELKKNAKLHDYFWECFSSFSAKKIVDTADLLLKNKLSKLFEVIYVVDYKSEKYYKRDKTQYYCEPFVYRGKDKKSGNILIANKQTKMSIMNEGILIDEKFVKYEELKMKSDKIKLSQEGINLNLKNESKSVFQRKINKDDFIMFLNCTMGDVSFLELTDKNSVYFYLLMLRKIAEEKMNKNLPVLNLKKKDDPKKRRVELKPEEKSPIKREFHSASSVKRDNKDKEILKNNIQKAERFKDDEKDDINKKIELFDEVKKTKSSEKTKYFLEFLNRYKGLKKDSKKAARIIFSITPNEVKKLEDLELNVLDVVNLVPKFTIYLVPFIEITGENQKEIVWGKRLEPQTVDEIKEYIEKIN
jgi:hypothetical protein